MSEDATVPAAAAEAATESEWRQQELDQRDRHHRTQLISVYVAAVLTLAGLIVTAIGIIRTLDGQQQEQQDAAEQFQRTLEQQEQQRAEDAEQFQQTLEAQGRQRREDARRFRSARNAKSTDRSSMG